jgi:hypothetical protein
VAPGSSGRLRQESAYTRPLAARGMSDQQIGRGERASEQQAAVTREHVCVPL